jgi:hypothetical protein
MGQIRLVMSVRILEFVLKFGGNINYFSDPVDSHLDTCGSISQVIEQLPQPNRTSRYINV